MCSLARALRTVLPALAAWLQFSAGPVLLNHRPTAPRTTARCSDGLNMFLRTLVLQLTFFLALAAAARLGTTALAGGWGCCCCHCLGYAAGTCSCLLANRGMNWGVLRVCRWGHFAP